VDGSRPLRAIVADDHHLSRQGLRGALEADGILVVSEAHDHSGAVEAANAHSPDVVVLDLLMPGSATAAIASITARDSSPKVVVLTVSTDPAHVVQALAAGASGFLLKEERADTVIAAVRSVVAGQAVLSSQALAALASRLPRPGAKLDGSTAPGTLTPRELTILRLIADGSSNESIAEMLAISPHTVKQHVSNIYVALGVHGRVEAAVRAVRDGLA
jgi:DNA-binding NarL/FixJ family response regulator